MLLPNLRREIEKNHETQLEVQDSLCPASIRARQLSNTGQECTGFSWGQ